jgi:hypothetical protein
MPASLQLGAGYRAEVPKLWGVHLVEEPFVLGGGVVCMGYIFILNEILAHD